MRCAQCGLPLSPTRNNCPRCGTPINTSNQAKGESPSHPISALVPQMPFSAQQSSQLSFESGQSIPQAEPVQEANMQASFPMPSPPSPLVSNPANNPPNRSGQPLANNSYLSTRDNSKTIRIGLTTAGLCIIMGSLLLGFVYLVGQGFLPAGGTTTVRDTHTTLGGNQTATATHNSTPTPLPVTPTPTLPSQGLLDTSVLASVFNEQTGQIIQTATSFKVNQKIYIVLRLHPGTNSHAVCLNWYLNDQSVNKFPLEVDPYSNYNYYSYTMMSTTGNGYVEISLASTTACTDAIVAKKLPFTIS
jgi:hypothetical protein